MESIFFIPCSLAIESALYKSVWPLKVPSTKPVWPWKVSSSNRFDHRKGLLQTGLAMESGQTGLRNFRSPPGRPQILMKLTFLLLFYTKTERPKIKCFTTAFSLEKLQTFYVTKRKRAKFNSKIFL